MPFTLSPQKGIHSSLAQESVIARSDAFLFLTGVICGLNCVNGNLCGAPEDFTLIMFPPLKTLRE